MQTFAASDSNAMTLLGSVQILELVDKNLAKLGSFLR